MTDRLPFTQASIRRMIKAAKAEGYKVTGIAMDGTLLLGDIADRSPSISPPTAQNDPFLAGVERVDENAQKKRERKRVAA